MKEAGESDVVDPSARVAALINAAVADLAAGRLDQSSKRLEAASRAASSGPTTSPSATPHFLSMAIDYNKALVLAAAKGEQGRRDAVELLQRNYLTQADPSSAWWTLAYEQYEKLCRELKMEPKPEKELQRRRGAMAARYVRDTCVRKIHRSSSRP